MAAMQPGDGCSRCARCNAVAAAMLMPRDQVLASEEVRVREGLPESWDYHALRDTAAPFGASAEAFARRLLTLGRITSDYYRARRAGSWLRTARRKRRLATAETGTAIRRVTSARAFVRRIADAYERRVIDSYTAN